MKLLNTMDEADQVVMEWECTNCGVVRDWSYMELVERGTPVCPYCDEDMSLMLEG